MQERRRIPTRSRQFVVVRAVLVVLLLAGVFMLIGAQWAAWRWNRAYTDARHDSDASCPYASRLHRV